MIRRLRSTASGELVCCVLFPVLFFGFWGAPASLANVVGTAVVVAFLLQGSAYWWLKAQRLADGGDADRWLAVFAVLQVVDVVLLGVSAVVIGASISTSGLAAGWVGVALWILAALEHVNYFHRQLMYDNRADLVWLVRRGLKRPVLARDLERHRRRDRGHRSAPVG